MASALPDIPSTASPMPACVPPSRAAEEAPVKSARTPGAVLLLGGPCRGADAAPTVRFSRDVLPILSESCFQCHGPDEKARKAKLRLDTAEGAGAVIKPRKGDESELILRVSAEADD